MDLRNTTLCYNAFAHCIYRHLLPLTQFLRAWWPSFKQWHFVNVVRANQIDDTILAVRVLGASAPLISLQPPMLFSWWWEQAACVSVRCAGLSFMGPKCLCTSRCRWLTCSNSSLIPTCWLMRDRRGNNSNISRHYWCYPLKMARWWQDDDGFSSGACFSREW